MPLFQSPSHTFATTAPELFSVTDQTKYRAVCLIARSSNAAPFQFGGGQITNTAGGAPLGKTDAFWINPGAPFRLSDFFVAGAVGDVVDSVCIPWGSDE